MQLLLVFVLAHVSSAQQSSLADQDASFQKLTKAYQGLLEFNHEIESKHYPKSSLRHSRRTLAPARKEPSPELGEQDKLAEEETKAEMVSSDLKKTVNEAIHHVRNGVGLKHDIAQEGVKVRMAEKKLQIYEHEVERLPQTRDSLFASLHHMLDTKVDLAQKGLRKREDFLHRNTEAIKEWKKKAEELKDVSKEKIKAKHMVKQALVEAEEEVAKATKKEKELRRKLESSTQAASEKLQSFQYAETRYQAHKAHEKHAVEETRVAKKSLDKLLHTLEVESQKVQESIENRKEQLDRKIHEVEEDKTKSSHELSHLKGELSEWKESKYRQKAQIERKKRDLERASEEAAAHKRRIKQLAKARAHLTARARDGGRGSRGSGSQPDSDTEDTD